MSERRAIQPRGLRRIEAAGYVGVSPTKFDEMVRRGDMPGGFRVDSIRLWDRQGRLDPRPIIDRLDNRLGILDGIVRWETHVPRANAAHHVDEPVRQIAQGDIRVAVCFREKRLVDEFNITVHGGSLG